MADFQEVMRQYKRMCEKNIHCSNCELNSLENDKVCRWRLMERPSAAEAIIMNWAAANPEKTMKDVLIEKFPKAKLRDDGTPTACVMNLGFPGYGLVCHSVYDCAACWNRPAPEE